MKKQIYFLLMGMSLSCNAFSQNSAVSATVDKQKILIGEQFHLDIKSSQGKGKPMPFFFIDSVPHFEILGKSKIDTTSTNGITLKQTITLTSWDSGKWVISTVGNLKIKPLIIEVGYTPMDSAKPYNDIKDIIEVQKPVSSNWYWYLIGAVVLVALFLLFFPPAKEKTIAAAPVSTEDVYKNALSRLEKLNASDETKYLYTEIIDIFRNYLEKRKNIQSFSKTTDDLSLQIKQLPLPDEQYKQLLQTLQMSDMVKFAKFLPQVLENEKAIEIIKQNIIAIENLH